VRQDEHSHMEAMDWSGASGEVLLKRCLELRVGRGRGEREEEAAPWGQRILVLWPLAKAFYSEKGNMHGEDVHRT